MITARSLKTRSQPSPAAVFEFYVKDFWPGCFGMGGSAGSATSGGMSQAKGNPKKQNGRFPRPFVFLAKPVTLSQVVCGFTMLPDIEPLALAFLRHTQTDRYVHDLVGNQGN